MGNGRAVVQFPFPIPNSPFPLLTSGSQFQFPFPVPSSRFPIPLAPHIPPMTRAGIATVAGRPNAGKSTLLNRLVGQKLAITSPKPQSTRRRVVGIISTDSAQLILYDTPGLLHPRYALHHAMRGEALSALGDADVIAYLVDATDQKIPSLEEVARLDVPLTAPVVTVFNKVDLLTDVERAALAQSFPDAVFVSAQSGEGISLLQERLIERLPESPFLYDSEDVSTQSMRFFVAELVRETALEQLDDEVPYSVACEIDEFREGQDPIYIRAVIFVERESQKRILIGHEGSRVREIGRAARAKIEPLVGSRVYLDLWVKVLDNWRRNVGALKRFGFVLPEERPS
jgi:GTP-binding protein Era